MKSLLVAVVVTVLASFASVLSPAASVAAPGDDDGFVTRRGPILMNEGKPYRFAGTNNYYLMYKSRTMVDAVLQKASAADFDVLRMWGSLERGTSDADSVHQGWEGVWFQYWDAAAQRPAYNDGPDGLERLDYAVAKAGAEGLKLVIPFVNNWNAFGGMDQYVRWAGGSYHDEFYTDPQIKQWYKEWISHVLERTNSITGVKYKDDPTIMTWELANEPRCLSAGAYPRSDSCTTDTITSWADEMSRYIKSIDANHLVSAGDEGFYCLTDEADPDPDLHWTDNCGEGVDTMALASLPAMDVLSFHLYPDHWSVDAAWGTEWVKRHAQDARRIGKPSMLGEFGLEDKSVRNSVYFEWTEAFRKAGGTGALYWILSDIQDDGSLYPDYDGYTVYCPSPVCTTMSSFAALMQRGGSNDVRRQGPIADHDTAVIDFGTSATLTPLANDVTYGQRIDQSTLDLDAATAGVQTTVTSPSGTFALQPDSTVTFSPADGFSGQATTEYVVADRRGTLSNRARITVTVKPDPGAAQVLYSFESGTEGWSAGSWQGDVGTLSQTSDYATEGSSALHAEVSSGAWFGVTFPAPLDLSTRSLLSYDLRTAGAGTSTAIALQTRDAFTWCQSTWGYVDAGMTTTVDTDLLSGVSCDDAALADVRGMFVWLSAGTFDVDNVRVV